MSSMTVHQNNAPATNQAGEVDHVLIDELRAVARAMQIVDFHARENDIDLKPATCRAIIHDAIAALATQPATSQEGGALRAILVEGLKPMATAERFNWGQRARTVLDQFPILVATPTPPTLSEDLQAIPDPACHRTGWSAKLIDGLWCIGMTGNLDTIHDAVLRVNRHGAWDEAEATARWVAETYTAALAQVKAS